MGWQEHAEADIAKAAERYQQDNTVSTTTFAAHVYARIGQLARTALDDETLGEAVLIGGGAKAIQALRDALTSEKGDTDGPA